MAELVIDDERQYHRILAYVRRTSPELAERVKLYKGKRPLFQRYEIEQGIRSTLSRRVPLPSGGSLVFDYGEAFTVVDVNTGRFTGTTKKLEDTILKNNLEAAVEVVRQLRLRDIGGIIVVDFIDMASQKNRDAVLEVLQRELKKDRSKVYVVEISPLGLVEMTRKNIADGVREIMTCECPVCEGTGRVLSDESLAIDMLRNLRRVARESKSEAFRVELEDGVARALIGAGGSGLDELEHETGRAFDVVGRVDVPREHFEVLAEGTLDEIGAEAPPCAPGDELNLPMLEPHRFVETDAVSRLSAGYEVQVIGGLPYVGTTQRLRIERATRFAAQAALLDVEPARPVAPPARRGRPSRTSTAMSWTRSPTSSSPSAASASGSTSRAASAGRSAARLPSSAASAGARAAGAAAGGGGGGGEAAATAPRRPCADERDERGRATARRRAAHERGRRGGGQAPRRRGGRGRRGRGGSGAATAPTPGENGVAERGNGAPAEPGRPRRPSATGRPRAAARPGPRQRSSGGAAAAAPAAAAPATARPAASSASPRRLPREPPQPAGAGRQPSTRDAPRAAAASEDERRKGLISRILGR